MSNQEKLSALIRRAGDIMAPQIPEDGSGQLVNPQLGKQAIDCAFEELILLGCNPKLADWLTGIALGHVMQAKQAVQGLQLETTDV